MLLSKEIMKFRSCIPFGVGTPYGEYKRKVGIGPYLGGGTPFGGWALFIGGTHLGIEPYLGGGTPFGGLGPIQGVGPHLGVGPYLGIGPYLGGWTLFRHGTPFGGLGPI